MAPSSQLAIATKSLNRLVKEEASYHKELEQQEARIAKVEKDSSDENAEYILKQERRAMDETKAMFPELKKKIQEAFSNLEHELAQSENQHSEEEISKAKEAAAAAKTAIQEAS